MSTNSSKKDKEEIGLIILDPHEFLSVKTAKEFKKWSKNKEDMKTIKEAENLWNSFLKQKYGIEHAVSFIEVDKNDI